jgi:geranylgeranylglycerol-phosphate geranylgeranyltransferase
MQKLFAVLELLRLKNCLMAGIATIIGFFLSINIISINLFLVFLATFFVCGGGQAINDVFDFDIDKKICKKKPLPSNRVSKKEAIVISSILFFVGIVLAFFINFYSFLIALIFVILLILYSSIFYKKKYFGNVIVALGTAITFVFGASATGNIPLIVFFFFIIAFFANMSRELIKDFEDLKKDKGFKKTLPMISKKITRLFILFYYFSSILLAFFVGLFFSLSVFYFVFIIITSLLFIHSFNLLLKKDFNKSQSFSKKGMLVSLVAFVLAIFK